MCEARAVRAKCDTTGSTLEWGGSRDLAKVHEGVGMKASTFMGAALAGAGTPAVTRSVIGAVPGHGGRSVGITPQLPDGSFGTADKDALTFVLSDIGNAVARLYGLVHALPEELCAVLPANNKEIGRAHV